MEENKENNEEEVVTHTSERNKNHSELDYTDYEKFLIFKALNTDITEIPIDGNNLNYTLL